MYTVLCPVRMLCLNSYVGIWLGYVKYGNISSVIRNLQLFIYMYNVCRYTHLYFVYIQYFYLCVVGVFMFNCLLSLAVHMSISVYVFLKQHEMYVNTYPANKSAPDSDMRFVQMK